MLSLELGVDVGIVMVTVPCVVVAIYIYTCQGLCGPRRWFLWTSNGVWFSIHWADRVFVPMSKLMTTSTLGSLLGLSKLLCTAILS